MSQSTALDVIKHVDEKQMEGGYKMQHGIPQSPKGLSKGGAKIRAHLNAIPWQGFVFDLEMQSRKANNADVSNCFILN